MAILGGFRTLPRSEQAAAWALAKSRVAQQAFTEALTKGTLRPRMLKARSKRCEKKFPGWWFLFWGNPEVLGRGVIAYLVFLDLFEVFFFTLYHGKSPSKPPFGIYSISYSLQASYANPRLPWQKRYRFVPGRREVFFCLEVFYFKGEISSCKWDDSFTPANPTNHPNHPSCKVQIEESHFGVGGISIKSFHNRERLGMIWRLPMEHQLPAKVLEKRRLTPKERILG